MLQLTYALVLTQKIVIPITHVFPVKQRSYLPCDGDFRQIGGHRKNTVDVPREWNDIIGSARHSTSPFKVTNLVK